MPEQVQKQKYSARTHWDAEPQIVGGRTKYPLYNPPEVSPVRDQSPFESQQYGQSREDQQKAQEKQYQQAQPQRKYRSDFRSDEKWDIEERRPQASWKVPGAPAAETQKYEAPQAPQQ